MKESENTISPENSEASHAWEQPPSSMLKVNADKSDRISVWGLCIVMTVLILLIILLGLAVPQATLELKNPQDRQGNGQACTNPSRFIHNNKLQCEDFSQSNPVLGLVAPSIRPTNQYILLYLHLEMGNDATSGTLIDQKFTLRIYTLQQKIEKEGLYYVRNFYRIKEITKETSQLVVEVDENNTMQASAMDHIYRMVGMIRDLQENETHYYFKFQFAEPIQLTYIPTKQILGYSLQASFTVFTVVIRSVFFFLSFISGIIYLRRYFQLEPDDRILEIKMVAVASILVCLFNDPFLFALTIFKPNLASAFVSLFFIVLFLVFLMGMWIFFMRLIRFSARGKENTLLGLRKNWIFLIYEIVLLVLLTILIMKFEFFVVKKHPIVDKVKLDQRLAAFSIVVFVIFLIGILYILIEFVIIVWRTCKKKQHLMHRYKQFLRYLLIFILFYVMCTAAGGTRPYSQRSYFILYGYCFLNLQIFLLQYLFYTPYSELDKARSSKGHIEIEQQPTGDLVR